MARPSIPYLPVYPDLCPRPLSFFPQGLLNCRSDTGAPFMVALEAGTELPKCRERQAVAAEQRRKAREAEQKEKERQRRAAALEKERAAEQEWRRREAQEQERQREAEDARRQAVAAAHEANIERRRAEAQARYQ